MADANLSFRIPEGGLNDLAAVAASARRLKEILTHLNGCPTRFDENLASKFVAEKTGMELASVIDVLDGLSAMRGLMARYKLTASAVFDTIRSSIERYASTSWKEKNLNTWISAQGSMVEALALIADDSPILVYQKTKELTYAHKHILTDVALVTDLRPVFDEGADKVQSIVLTHVLTISYQDGLDSRSIEFALDASDVLRLQKATERAQKKTAVLRKLADGDSWLPLVIAGQSSAE